MDCGSGVRRLGNVLAREGVRRLSILFTHSHWDHILGFPFFKPLYDSAVAIDFFGCPFAQRSVRSVIKKVMQAPQFPINLGALKAQLRFHAFCLEAFRIGSLRIEPIVLSHPNQGLGFKFEEAGKVFVFLTDNELAYRHPGGRRFADYAAFCAGADILIHDAEFTDADYRRTRTWGHSTYRQALELALKAGVKRFGLCHHNQDRPDAEVDAMVRDCRRLAARKGRALDCFGVTQDTVLDL